MTEQDTTGTTTTSKLPAVVRRKRVWVAGVAALAVLGAGGVGLGLSAASADDSRPVTGGDRDRVGEAALDAVGGGELLGAETSDDRGEAYEVDVLDGDGVEWTITLDDDLGVVERDRDDDRYDDRDDDRDVRPDADDRPVLGSERERVEAAAVDEVGSGEAVSVDRSDDRGEAFEVEVVDADGVEWDVTLDEQLAVLDSRRDGR